MAIPVTNIPVLTGEVAERFIKQCDYNAKHLRGSQWKGDFEDVYKEIIARSPILQREKKKQKLLDSENNKPQE